MKRSFDDISNNRGNGHPSSSPLVSSFPENVHQGTERSSISSNPSLHNVAAGQTVSGGAVISTTPSSAQMPIPRISRKIRACTECKKQKVKCDMPVGQTTCTRCARQKLECVVNRSLQTILDDDMEWKTKLSEDNITLQRAVSDILYRFQMPPLNTYTMGDVSPSGDTGHHSPIHQPSISRIKPELVSNSPTAYSQPTTPNGPLSIDTQLHTRSMPRQSPIAAAQQYHNTGNGRPQLPAPIRSASVVPMARITSQDAVDDQEDETGLAIAPMGSLYEVTKLKNLQSNPSNGKHSRPQRRLMADDYVSRGIIDLNEAEQLFQTFNRSLNHYLWGGIALVHTNLISVRQSSSLLSSAIFTVSALHLPDKHHLFDRCYEEFLAIVSASMFDRYHCLDDIRGFCIGAFWLSEISWRLSSHAIRVGTELNLHQAFTKAIAGSAEHYERARLWYLLYVCDKHFSIAYGRPPVICENDTIRNHELYLKSPMALVCDYRIISQVALFIILSRMYDAFGPDMDLELQPEHYILLQGFNRDLDSWKMTFQNRLPPNEFVASYPSKGVNLHYHFAKLQLNCLSLRGVTRTSIHNISDERRAFANSAIEAAATTLNIVLNEPDIRDSLLGVPLYIHTMIAFAAVFLMKIATKWKSIGFTIDPPSIWLLVSQIIQIFQQTEACEHHLIYFIATGLEKMLKKCKEWENHKDMMEDSLLWDALLRAGGVTPEALRTQFMPVGASGGGTPGGGGIGVGYRTTTTADGFGPEEGGERDMYGYQTTPASMESDHQHHQQQQQQSQQHMQQGQGMVYDTNYFPMGIYDFLTTQMPG